MTSRFSTSSLHHSHNNLQYLERLREKVIQELLLQLSSSSLGNLSRVRVNQFRPLCHDLRYQVWVSLHLWPVLRSSTCRQDRLW